MESEATIDYEYEDHPDLGREMECVYATCIDSGDRVGPVWGYGGSSVRRALAQLTEECSCGADWHRDEDAD